MHHLDTPWRPADIEQRDGRILRQGNQNPEVQVIRDVTQGSFDTYMWLVNRTRAIHHPQPSRRDYEPGVAHTMEATVANDWPEDPWGDAVPLREVAAIEVRLVGAVVSGPDDSVAFGVSFPDDVRAERAANAYLVDLADTFARPLTLRSYGYDILRWLRFLAAASRSTTRFAATTRTFVAG